MILRPILFLHRWLGIIIGLVMTLWCLSGFVMMYSPYPRLQPMEQLRGLAPIEALGLLQADLDDETALLSARVERSGDTNILRITPAVDPGRPIAQMRATPQNIDLNTGQPVSPTSQDAALAIGNSFASHYKIDGKPLSAAPITIDQWTVQTAKRHQPLWRVDYEGGDTAYVAGSGEVVQHTTRSERFWGWLGAVPHWLYPTVLRQNGALWSQVVIWTSLTGCFLTITGMWVGIARLRRNREGNLGSPYRGLWWWHHMVGLFFGILTLTWVASGLVSMGPFGFLNTMAGFAERERVAGTMRWGDVRSALSNMKTLPEGTVRVEANPVGGKTYLAAVMRDGAIQRFDAQGNPSPLTQSELISALGNGPKLASLDLLREEDAYYYAHHNPAPLPVWRAILDDDQATRLYIDANTGRLIRAFDANGRSTRWLMNGLHSLDLPGLRLRPIWDFIMIPLLAMVTLVCATGTWMSIAKVRRDIRSSRNRRRRRASAALTEVTA